MASWMMKNSNGKPDGMWTFSCVSFAITTLVILMSIVKELKLGDFTLSFDTPDVALLTMYIGTTFGSYVFRRTTKDKQGGEVVEESEKKE
jgi:hypothetical protein